jgi:hypothetical protein
MPSNHADSLTPTHSLSRSKACAGRSEDVTAGAKKAECLIADKTWKYARVPTTENKTIVSMGEKVAWVAKGLSTALTGRKKMRVLREAVAEGI